MRALVVACLCTAAAAAFGAAAPPEINVSWTQLNALAAPSQRRAATLTSLSSQLVLFGGESWVSPLVTGGSDWELQTVTDDQNLWFYDPANKMWSMPPAGNSPGPRAGHAAASVPSSDGSTKALLVAGGRRYGTDGARERYLDDLWLYSADKTQWSCLSCSKNSSLPAGRADHSLTLVSGSSGQNLTYVMFGGRNCAGVCCPGLADVWSIQLSLASASATWAQLSPAGLSARALYGHGAAYLNGRLYVLGGVQVASPTCVVSGNISVLQLNLSHYSWQDIQQASPRCFHSLQVGGSQMFSVGGFDSATAFEQNNAVGTLLTYTGTAQAPDLSVDKYGGALASRQYARGFASAAVVPGDVIDTLVAFGGNMYNLTYAFQDLWLYHNQSIAEIYGGSGQQQWSQVAGGRSNGAVYCDTAPGVVCNHSKSGADLVMLGGLVQAPQLNLLSQNLPAVGGQCAVKASLDNNSSMPVQQKAEPFVPAVHENDSLGYFSMVRLSNGSRLVFGGLWFPEVLAATQHRVQSPEDEYPQPNSFLFMSGAAGAEWSVSSTSGFGSNHDATLERFLHCSVVYGSGTQEKMLVWGGGRVRENWVGWVSLLELDVSTGVWTDLDTSSSGSPSLPKFGHSCVVQGTSLIVFGGAFTNEEYQIPDRWSPVTDMWQYNIASRQWIQLRSSGVPPFPTILHTANLMFNQTRMVVVGGIIKRPQAGQDKLILSDAVVVVDLDPLCLSGSEDAYCYWLQVHTPGVEHFSDIMPGRYGHSSIDMSNDNDKAMLLIAGGISDVSENGTVASDMWGLKLKVLSPSPTPTPGPGKTVLGMSVTVLILIIVGVLATIGAAVVGWRIYVRRRRMKKTRQLLADLNSKSGKPHALTGGGQDDEENLLAIEPSSAWEADFAEYLADAQGFVIDFDSLRIVKQIGHGATCVVHVGWWGNTPVAIKRFFLNQNFQFKDFCRETLVHRDLKHKNVLELLAITVSPACSITPLMRFGSLFHLLQSAEELSYSVILQLATDAACGMHYLHSQGVLHRDLKTLNLLIDDAWTVKVADFGTSRFQISAMTTGVGSVQYMAPEVFVSNYSTTKADVYSFSIILWEMVSRKVPYGEVNSPFIVCCDVRNGVRLEMPPNTRPEYAALIEACWAQNANERPSFEEVLEQLSEMTAMAEQDSGVERGSFSGPRDLKASFNDVTDLRALMASPTHTGSNTDCSAYLAPEPTSGSNFSAEDVSGNMEGSNQSVKIREYNSLTQEGED